MLGDYIAINRYNKGISQEELAYLLNVSRQTIYKWENNICKPNINHLFELIDIFCIKDINEIKKNLT